MKLVKVQIELIIDDDENFYLPNEISSGVFTPRFDNDKIAQYLNNKLYTDPEFFGDFGPENIVEVKEWE
jgi:hypothetical protein